jgi:hypothetical protein
MKQMETEYKRQEESLVLISQKFRQHEEIMYNMSISQQQHAKVMYEALICICGTPNEKGNVVASLKEALRGTVNNITILENQNSRVHRLSQSVQNDHEATLTQHGKEAGESNDVEMREHLTSEEVADPCQ